MLKNTFGTWPFRGDIEMKTDHMAQDAFDKVYLKNVLVFWL